MTAPEFLRDRADAYDNAADTTRDHPLIAEDCRYVARELRWLAHREERDSEVAA